MKKIKFILTILSFMLVYSCSKDNKSDREITQGAIPKITKVAGSQTDISSTLISTNTPLNLAISIGVQTGFVASMDIVGYYKNAAGNVYKGYFKKGITTFPTVYNFSQTDIVNAFSNIVVPGDIVVGDVIDVSTEMTLNNGSIVRIFNNDGSLSIGSGIITAYPDSFQTYTVN